MAETPSKTLAMAELGVAGAYYPGSELKHDEFINELRGIRGIKKYREMRENDPVVGSVLTSMDMMIRAVEWDYIPGTGAGAEDGVNFMKSIFSDMESTFEEFLSEVLTLLPYGFSVFETVYKRRLGRNTRSRHSSKYNDGLIGLKKLAPRAQWTVERFDVNRAGEILGMYQNTAWLTGTAYIPWNKMLLFRTTSANNDPSGRSVLRNAYISYHYASHIQKIESIAIEREMNGLPVGRVPSEMMRQDADDSAKAFVAKFTQILRDVRRNEQGFVMLPSDMQENDNGSLGSTPKVGFELMASKGTRDIDTNKVISRHQQNIARTVLADFLMLGQSERGSFALSQSKTDLFLRSIEGYVKSIAAVLNKNLIPRIWALNGFDEADMPKIKPGPVAPVDLDELGRYVSRIAGVDENIFGDSGPLRDALLNSAKLPSGESLGGNEGS